MNELRTLTPEDITAIKYFYRRPIFMGFGTVFILVFGIQLAFLTAFLLKLNMPLTAGIYVALVIGIDQLLHSRKVVKAKAVYRFGNETNISLVNIVNNYSLKMGGRPQQIITIDKGGEVVKIRTFSDRVIDAFAPASQKAYVDARYPDVVLPAIIFTKGFYDPDMPERPRPKIKSFDI